MSCCCSIVAGGEHHWQKKKTCVLINTQHKWKKLYLALFMCCNCFLLFSLFIYTFIRILRVLVVVVVVVVVVVMLLVKVQWMGALMKSGWTTASPKQQHQSSSPNCPLLHWSWLWSPVSFSHCLLFSCSVCPWTGHSVYVCASEYVYVLSYQRAANQSTHAEGSSDEGKLNYKLQVQQRAFVYAVAVVFVVDESAAVVRRSPNWECKRNYAAS